MFKIKGEGQKERHSQGENSGCLGAEPEPKRAVRPPHGISVGVPGRRVNVRARGQQGVIISLEDSSATWVEIGNLLSTL